MDRPPSIVNFERLYLGALASSILTTAITWPQNRARLAAAGLSTGSPGVWLGALIGFAIALVLWYFIARRGSLIAKWIATVLLVLGWIAVILTVPTGTFAHGIAGVIGIVRIVLETIAIWLLFRPDAEAWFGETPDVPEDAA